MRHSFIITVAGGAGLALASSAQAVPLTSLHAAPLTVRAADEGTYIKEGEYPNLVPPGSQPDDSPAPQQAPSYAAPATGGDSSAGEVPELQRAFPSTEWPPSMRHD